MEEAPEWMLTATAWPCYRIDCERCNWINYVEDTDVGAIIKCEGCSEEIYIHQVL